MKYVMSALVVLASLITAASAQDQRLFIKAGQMVDVAAGRLLPDQVIVVQDGLISQVGSASGIRIPAGVDQIDLSDATVLPGLIDAHVHLTHDEHFHGYQRVIRSAMRQAVNGVGAAEKTLRAGFTTVRNVGANQFGDVAIRDAINDGDIDGPRMLVSGPPLGITGGHCDYNYLPPQFDFHREGVADGPWGVRQKVRENIKYGVDVIKFCATGGVLSQGTTLGARQYTLEEMAALVDEAHTLGRKVTAHAHGTEGIKMAIRAGVDSVEHASILDDEAIQLALDHQTTFVMDIYVSDFILESGSEAGITEESLAKERQVGQVQRDNFRRAYEAGINIVFGSDAGVYPHGQNGRQFEYMVQYGMTPMEAIQAATVRAAELLGLSDQVGSISVGLQADLIAVEENPLENVRSLESVGFVMKGGTVYVRDSLLN